MTVEIRRGRAVETSGDARTIAAVLPVLATLGGVVACRVSPRHCRIDRLENYHRIVIVIVNMVVASMTAMLRSSSIGCSVSHLSPIVGGGYVVLGGRFLYCVEGDRALGCFPASGGSGEEVFFGGGVVGEGGAVRARGVGDQFEVAPPVEVGVGFCEEEFGGGDDVRMWGRAGEIGVGALMTDRGGVVLFGVNADAAGAAHRVAAAMSRAVSAWPHTALSVAVIETSRTWGCGTRSQFSVWLAGRTRYVYRSITLSHRYSTLQMRKIFAVDSRRHFSSLRRPARWVFPTSSQIPARG